ncbi:MAG: 6-bladed beta-propeller [Bacteroidia bacterium]|nr:6-bladed beta-propeller [Bacteroidia bacterium]
MRNIISLLIIPLLILGCTNDITNNSIKVDIDTNDNVSIYDFFSNIEIVKLDLNDSSVISYFGKVISYNDMYYILDYRFPVIYLYTNQGKYLSKIDNQGQGPNEYIQISDFEIDTISKKLAFVDPTNSTLHEYDLNGNFKKRTPLPTLNRSYYKLNYLNSELMVFWTFDYDNRVKFYSLTENKIVKETFPEEDNILNNSLLDFSYGNFLCRPVSNIVFEFTTDCEIKESYKWDFGSLNNDMKKLYNNSETYSKMEPHAFNEKVRSSEIVNYIFASNGGNSTYVMTQIVRKNKVINVLHNKKLNKSFVFEKTKENASFFPIFWTEEYVIGKKLETENSLDGCLPDEILDDRNRAIKNSITEFDNPILIKYYFRNK